MIGRTEMNEAGWATDGHYQRGAMPEGAQIEVAGCFSTKILRTTTSRADCRFGILTRDLPCPRPLRWQTRPQCLGLGVAAFPSRI